MMGARSMHKSHKPLTAEGHAIINEIMTKRMIGVKDFFGTSRLPHLANARRTAIRQLRAAGFTYKVIAYLVRCNATTVAYWLNPKSRSRRVARAMAYSHREIAA